MKEIMPEMNAIVREYQTDPNAQLLELLARGQALCERAGQGAKAVVHSSKTLTHPRNRGNAMLDIPTVPTLLADISDVAFSLQEVSNAAAVRLPNRGSKQRRAIELENERLVIRAQGTLAPVIRDDADIMVTSCNHNSAGLKAANAGAKCSIERISDAGRYSVAKICERCPSYTDPLRVGLTYFVYEYVVEEQCPAYIDMAIEAANVGSALARPDNFVELTKKAVNHSKSCADWDMVIAKMLRAKPALHALVPDICKWVQNWGGKGDPPIYMHSLAVYVQASETLFHHNVTVELLQKLNKMDLGTGKGAQTRCSVLKGAITRTNGISATMLSKLTSGNGLTLALKGEADLEIFEKHVRKAADAKNALLEELPLFVIKALGDAEISVVAYACGQAKHFKGLADIMKYHFDEMLKAGGIQASNPYNQAKAPKVAITAPRAAVVQVGPAGFSTKTLERLAEDKGFKPDCIISKRKVEHADEFVIIEFDGANAAVYNRHDAKKQRVEIPLQDIVDSYGLTVVETVVENVKATHDLFKSPKDIDELLKSFAIAAMTDVVKHCDGMNGNVSVVMNPANKTKVIANVGFDKDLEIFCITRAVKMATDKASYGGDANITVKHSGLERVYEPMKPSYPDGSHQVCFPFFFVKTHPKYGNAILAKRTVKIGQASVELSLIVAVGKIKKGEEIVLKCRA